MLEFSKRIAIAFFVLVLTGCASQKAHIDYDTEANFESYESFAWAGEDQKILFRDETDRYVSALNMRRIKMAIEDELAAGGFYQTDKPDGADFLISFTVGVRDVLDANHFRSYPTGRWYRHWPYSHGLDVEIDFHTHTEGMLAIDIYDAESGLPVWHGVTRKHITGEDIKDSKEAIEKAVKSILSGFPPYMIEYR